MPMLANISARPAKHSEQGHAEALAGDRAQNHLFHRVIFKSHHIVIQGQKTLAGHFKIRRRSAFAARIYHQ
jgi:hypothetical protein